MRSKRPELKRETNVTNEEVRDRDWSNKRGAATKSVEVGDKVLLKVQKTNKLSPNFHPSPFKVVNKEGAQVTVKNDPGVELKQNSRS